MSGRAKPITMKPDPAITSMSPFTPFPDLNHLIPIFIMKIPQAVKTAGAIHLTKNKKSPPYATMERSSSGLSLNRE